MVFTQYCAIKDTAKRNDTKTSKIALQVFMAFVAIALLIILFSQNIILALSVTFSLVLVCLLSGLVAKLLLFFTNKVTATQGSYWQLAFSGIQQRKKQSLLLIVIFSLALTLLLVQVIIKSSVIDEFKASQAQDATNFVLADIQANDVEAITAIIAEANIHNDRTFPMVLSRIKSLNGEENTPKTNKNLNEPASSNTEKSDKIDLPDHEITLVSLTDLPEENTISQGQWWTKINKSSEQLPSISIDQYLSNSGIKLGDQVTLNIGGMLLKTKVSSIRQVDAKGLSLNRFPIIIEPSVLSAYSASYVMELNANGQQESSVHKLARTYPNIRVHSLASVLKNINNNIEQITQALSLVLSLTLIAGALVLISAVNSTIDSRKQQVGLLRALGSSQKLMLSSTFIEFALIGFLAGTIAIIGAESLLIGLQVFIFKIPVQPHYIYWALTPLLSAMLIALLGVNACRPALKTPPMAVLREAL